MFIFRKLSFGTMLLCFFASSFFLHLLWENLQAPLFADFVSYRQHFLPCLKAAATGDMVFMAIIYLMLAAAYRSPAWIADRRSYAHPATWLLPVFMGIPLAVMTELRAVYVVHSWAYASTMPLLPFYHVGLTPVFQMIIVPLLVLLLIKWMISKTGSSTFSTRSTIYW